MKRPKKSHKIKNTKRRNRFSQGFKSERSQMQEARTQERLRQEHEGHLKKMEEAKASYQEYKIKFPSMGDTLLEYNYQTGKITKEAYDKCKEMG